MLQFVTGRAGSGKTEFLRRMLVDLSGHQRGLMMIVPEQYSFETEKAILHLAGPKRANQIDVLSFTRLCDLYFRTKGGAAGERLSDGGRRMLMSLAAEACADQLTVYQKAVRDGRITDMMLTAVHEMKLCGISGDLLRETAGKTERGLAQKLEEISLVYDTYSAMVSASYLDPRDDLTRLAEALEGDDFFAGRVVAIDSFEGFTMQEMTLLALMMKQADNVIVSLCTDSIPAGSHGLFALTERTRNQLTWLARENGVKIAPDLTLKEAPRFQNPNLHTLERGLFSDEPLPSENHEGIHLFSAKDRFDEVDFVAATIRRLVMEQGLFYRDFSIVCRAPETYAGMLETAFERRDIPCFISHPSRVDAEPLMRFILCAFEAVMHGMNPEDLFDMLKTGISGLTAENISDLENYSFLWQLKGRHWREAFTKHPQGFGREMTEADERALLHLNKLREAVLAPLTRFAKRSAHATGIEISHAIYDLLTDFGMEENLHAYCKTLQDAHYPALAEKQIRIWDLLIEILEQMAAILGDKPIGRERYYRLLREVIQGEDVSDIPQVLDAVFFGMPEQIRQTSPKVVFLLGAVQGEFPMIPKNAGVFSDAERQKLIELDLPLSDPLPLKMLQERYLAYSAASLPSEALYLCYPAGLDGEAMQPSELVSGICEIFPSLAQEQLDRISYFGNSREAAFSLMAQNLPYRTAASAALQVLFADDPDYQGRLAALGRAVDASPEAVEDAALAKRVFGHISYLSPTQIETFYQCKFRYFCQFGVNAKERRTAEIDAMQYGTLMHYLFEQIFSKKLIDPTAADDDELLACIRGLIEAYVQENLGGWENISGREQYRLRRVIRSAARLIRHVARELSQSRFEPKGFEISLGSQDFPKLKIRTPEGNEVTVGGKIDRIDLYESPRGKFVRVIDYKTGIKEFRLADVLYGMNIQMLVYLAALAESGELRPAGILYTPLIPPSVTADRSADMEELLDMQKKSLRMTGLILKDEEIVRAMEEQAEGRFIPAKLLKSGKISDTGSVLESAQLRAVLGYAKSLIATMADTLYHGQIEAKPIIAGQLGCTYCPYRSVCGKEYTAGDIEKNNAKKQEILLLMQGEENENGDALDE